MSGVTPLARSVEVTAGNDIPPAAAPGDQASGGYDRLAERVAVAVAGFLGRYKGQSRVHTGCWRRQRRAGRRADRVHRCLGWPDPRIPPRSL